MPSQLSPPAPLAGGKPAALDPWTAPACATISVFVIGPDGSQALGVSRAPEPATQAPAPDGSGRSSGKAVGRGPPESPARLAPAWGSGSRGQQRQGGASLAAGLSRAYLAELEQQEERRRGGRSRWAAVGAHGSAGWCAVPGLNFLPLVM